MRGRKKKPAAPKHVRLRRGDKVIVIQGPDKGKGPAEVLSVDRQRGRVVVKGVNVRTKHLKKTQKNPQGGVQEVESSVALSNVLLYSEKLKRGVRIKSEVKDGKKVRVGVPCGTVFE